MQISIMQVKQNERKETLPWLLKLESGLIEISHVMETQSQTEVYAMITKAATTAVLNRKGPLCIGKMVRIVSLVVTGEGYARTK